ncbi:unnamed protein product [Ectocarpus fasciculatus]
MVTMMARSTALRDPSAPGCLDAIGTGDGIGTLLGGTQLPMDPSTCIFWCAVALGALVKGSPLEAVANYFRLARVSLDSYTGPANPEVARAWTILGYLYGFMGDMAKFEEYLGFADSFLAASIKEGSTDMLPVGFAEIVHHKDTVKVCSDNLDPADMESFCARHRDAPQVCVSEAVNDGELYRYVTQSFKVFQQVTYAKACAKSSCRRRVSGDECRAEGGGGVSARDNGPLEDDVLDAMATGLRGYVIEFEQLEETANRPRIRAGVGGLIINGTLVFERAAKGDAEGTLERIRHCVEVFERYPGLCRCMMRWCHIAHAMLASLAALDGSEARRLYDRLRAAYNAFRPPKSPPVPALEDWQGIAPLCEDFLCRTIEALIASEGLSVFATPTTCTSHCYVSGQKNSEEDLVQNIGEEAQRRTVSTGTVADETVRLIPTPSCSGQACPATSFCTSESKEDQQAVSLASPGRSPSHLRCGPSEAFSTDAPLGSGAAGLVDLAPDELPISPAFREAAGAIDEMDGDRIVADDWLDTIAAMLDTMDDLGPVNA